MTRRPFLVISAMLIAGWACNLDAIRDGSPLTFSIVEGYVVDPPPPPPQIGLFVATEREYGCAGYRLEHAFSVSGNVLRVGVSDRVTPPGEACATVMSPAGFRVVLPITIGTYSLEFTRDGVTDRYALTVTDTTIDITTLAAQFTHPTALTFPRAN